MTMLLLEVSIGYLSPDTEGPLHRHQEGRLVQGDATLLQPTIMCTVVPLILDRIFENLTDGVAEKKGNNFRRLDCSSSATTRYKLRWAGWGLNCSLLDLKNMLGGLRVDLMIVRTFLGGK